MSTPPRSPRRLPLWPLAALAVVVVRGLIAASRMDELELERYGATIAMATRHGLPLDPTELPIVAHLRGSYLFGLLLVPLTAAFGNTLWVVKGLAIGWSALGAALAVHLAERTLGRRAAFATLALFLFAWPAFLKVDVLALGSHADTIPFLLAPLVLLAHADPERGPGPGRLALLGALVGLGALFSMQFLVALPAIAAFAFLGAWRGLRPSALGLGLAVLAALPGLWWMKQLTPTTRVVNKNLEDRFLADGLGGAFDRAISFLGTEFHRSWQFDVHGGALFRYLFAASLLVALVLGVASLQPRRWFKLGSPSPWPDRLLVFALLHFLAFVGAYAVTDFRINLDAAGDGMGSRYMMPLLPALALVLAVGVRRAAEVSGRPAAVGLTVLPLVCGAVGFGNLYAPREAASLPPITGSELYAFRSHLAYATGEDYEARVAWVEKIEPSWPEDRPLAFSMAFAVPEANSLEVVFRAAGHLRGEREPVHQHLGSALGLKAMELYVDSVTWNGAAAARQLADRIGEDALRIPGSIRDDFFRGVGRGLTRTQLTAVVQSFFNTRSMPADLGPAETGFLIASNLPETIRDETLFGMGFFLGLRATPYERAQDAIYETLPQLPEPILEAWMTGFARGYRFRFVEATYREPGPLRLERSFEPREREAFRRALAATARP